MKYYEYISDSKVDILLPQIPIAFKQKLAGEIGINIGVLSAKISAEHATLEERATRVRILAEYIRNNEDIGTIENQKSWIRDQKLVRCGFVGSDKKLIAYCWRDGATRFMLAGSSGHLIGTQSADPKAVFGYSFLPRMLEAFDLANRKLEAGLSEESIKEWISKRKPKVQGQLSDDEYRSWYFMNFDEYIADVVSRRRSGRARAWGEIIFDTWDSLDGPETKVEFLAKRLFQVDEPPRGETERVLLAPPLFVSSLHFSRG